MVGLWHGLSIGKSVYGNALGEMKRIAYGRSAPTLIPSGNWETPSLEEKESTR